MRSPTSTKSTYRNRILGFSTSTRSPIEKSTPGSSASVLSVRHRRTCLCFQRHGKSFLRARLSLAYDIIQSVSGLASLFSEPDSVPPKRNRRPSPAPLPRHRRNVRTRSPLPETRSRPVIGPPATAPKRSGKAFRALAASAPNPTKRQSQAASWKQCPKAATQAIRKLDRPPRPKGVERGGPGARLHRKPRR